MAAGKRRSAPESSNNSLQKHFGLFSRNEEFEPRQHYSFQDIGADEPQEFTVGVPLSSPNFELPAHALRDAGLLMMEIAHIRKDLQARKQDGLETKAIT